MQFKAICRLRMFSAFEEKRQVMGCYFSLTDIKVLHRQTFLCLFSWPPFTHRPSREGDGRWLPWQRFGSVADRHLCDWYHRAAFISPFYGCLLACVYSIHSHFSYCAVHIAFTTHTHLINIVKAHGGPIPRDPWRRAYWCAHKSLCKEPMTDIHFHAKNHVSSAQLR